MSGKRKPTTMDSYCKKEDYIARLEAAGDVSGRTKAEADQENKINQVFDVEIEEPKDQSLTDRFWRLFD